MARRRTRPRGRTSGSERSLARRILRYGLIACAAGIVLGLAGLAWLWPRCSGAACPSVTALRDYTPPQASRVYDGQGRVVAHLAPERRIVVPLERIPARVAGAFLAVEDKRFFRH
ncbi:MAG TPA: hypothetical protein VNP72_10415, partial [Longimicrobium sp.]|nr:hypothetical protein [Longimicrobium sp.]